MCRCARDRGTEDWYNLHGLHFSGAVARFTFKACRIVARCSRSERCIAYRGPCSCVLAIAQRAHFGMGHHVAILKSYAFKNGEGNGEAAISAAICGARRMLDFVLSVHSAHPDGRSRIYSLPGGRAILLRRPCHATV